MIYYFIISFVILLLLFVDISNKKSDANDIDSLLSQFNVWLKDSGKVATPSNALFTELFKKRYGKETHKLPVIRGNRSMLLQDNADVIGSFPSKNSFLVSDELTILENLKSYYEYEYQKAKSFIYIVEFIIQSPLKLIRYLGVDEDHLLSKLVQVIFWIFTLFKPLIEELISKLIFQN